MKKLRKELEGSEKTKQLNLTIERGELQNKLDKAETGMQGSGGAV